MKILGREIDIIPGFVPVDTQAGANNGDWISLKNARGVAVVFFKAAGTANDDPVFTFQQAQDVAGTGAKNLAVVTTHYQKQGTLTAVGTWSKVTQAASQTLTLDGTSAENQGLYVVEIEADQLDVDNGFDCVRANIADTGAAGAQLGALLYVPYGLAYPSAPENLPSMIID